LSQTTEGDLGTHLPTKPKKEKEKTFRASINFNGKLRQRRFPNTREGQRDAKEWIAEIRGIKARWKAGLDVTQDITLGEYCEVFLRRKSKPTQRTYEPGLKQMIWDNPDLKNLKMSEAKKVHFHHLFSDHGVIRKSGLSDRTYNLRMGLMRTVFAEAMREEIPCCLSNPLLLFGKMKPKEKTWKALDDQSEASQILALARDRFEGRDYPIIFLCMNSGARISSVLGWRWKDVDFLKRTITLREMFTRDAELRNTKVGLKARPGQVRTHAMSEGLTRFLTDLRVKSKWAEAEDFIVKGTSRFMPLHYQTAYVRLVSLAKEFEKKHGRKIALHFHKFRHTFAVQYLASGGRLEELKEFLDHADIKTTQVYGKIQSDTMHQQANIVSFEPTRKSDDRVLTIVSGA
jgi:integrase